METSENREIYFKIFKLTWQQQRFVMYDKKCVELPQCAILGLWPEKKKEQVVKPLLWNRSAYHK